MMGYVTEAQYSAATCDNVAYNPQSQFKTTTIVIVIIIIQKLEHNFLSIYKITKPTRPTRG
jgi:hypothetical protein